MEINKRLIKTFAVLSVLSNFTLVLPESFAGNPNEVQVGGDEPALAKNPEINKDVSTSSTPSAKGCKPLPVAGCQARFICTGQATIMGEDQSDVQDALDAAEMIANANVAYFRGNKIAAQQALTQAQKNYQKKGPEGTQSSKELGRLQEQTITRGTEDYLQGVAVLATKSDLAHGLATVYVGQSCDTVSAAQQSVRSSNLSNQNDKGQPSSQNNSTTKPVNNSNKMGGPNVGAGKPESYEEKINHDF